MFRLTPHRDVLEDLRAIKRADPTAFFRITALFEQIKADPKLLDALTDHDFGAQGTQLFNVKKWVEHWRRGTNLWRMRVWDLDSAGMPYRIIYGYEVGRSRHHILGVIHHRGFNYEPDHPFTKRVLAAYDEVCR